jgi:hypothetical protein
MGETGGGSKSVQNCGTSFMNDPLHVISHHPETGSPLKISEEIIKTQIKQFNNILMDMA